MTSQFREMARNHRYFFDPVLGFTIVNGRGKLVGSSFSPNKHPLEALRTWCGENGLILEAFNFQEPGYWDFSVKRNESTQEQASSPLPAQAHATREAVH